MNQIQNLEKNIFRIKKIFKKTLKIKNFKKNYFRFIIKSLYKMLQKIKIFNKIYSQIKIKEKRIFKINNENFKI